MEEISVDEFNNDKKLLMEQLSATRWSSYTRFYRKTCSPLNVPHFMRYGYGGDKLVWWDEQTFLKTSKLPTTVGSKFRRGTSNVQFGQFRELHIYGMTKQSVAQAIEQILYLRDDTFDIVHIGSMKTRPLTPTTFMTSRFLDQYVKANPQRRLYLGCGCKLSIKETVAIISHPGPLNVGLDCSFTDQGRTFVRELAKRTTHVGTIAMYRDSFNDYFAKFSSIASLSDVRSALFKLSVETHSWIFEDAKRLLPLSFPTR